MYRVYIKISILLLMFSGKAFGQKAIEITGYVTKTVTEKFGNSELSIRLKHTTNRDSEGEIFAVPIDADGKFKTLLNLKEDVAYVSFEMMDLKNKGNYYNLSDPNWKPLKHVYLIEAGDTININIAENGDLKFSGKGSYKLNCQWQLLHQEILSKSEGIRLVSLAANGDIKQSLYFKDQLYRLAIIAKEALLNTYKSQLSDQIYQQLYVDAVANVEFELLWSLSRSASTFKQAINQQIVKEYYSYYLDKSIFKNSNVIADEIVRSAYAAELLFEQMLTSVTVYQPNGNLKDFDVSLLCQRIVTNYSGSLRDKMLFIFFERMNWKYASIIRNKIDNALAIMHEGIYKTLLMDWKVRKYQAFPFELMDVKGRMHKLSDYKGRLLVIDFWYTGCPNCIVLNEQMHPIVAKYKGVKEVVFLTVSIDKDKEKWKKSIESKKYTSSQSINLYTNGLGLDHDLIRNYNFIGFPQQLIIGRNGELITSSPPRPNTVEATQQFIDLIANYL